MTQPSGGLEGYAALVTGGGTGIGRACAERLAVDGAAVTIIGRTESRLEDAAALISTAIGERGAANGGSVQYTTADVTDEESVQAAVEYALGSRREVSTRWSPTRAAVAGWDHRTCRTSPSSPRPAPQRAGHAPADEVRGAAPGGVGPRLVRRHVVDRG